MNPWRGFRRTLFVRPNRGGIRAEIDEELQYHILRLEAELRAEGRSADEIEQEVERRFGSCSGHARACHREVRGRERRKSVRGAVEGVLQDIGYAVRGVRRGPGFAFAVVLTLGLGLGATSAIFSAIDATLLRPPPYPEPERVVEVGISGADPTAFYPALRDFRTAAEVTERSPFLDASIVVVRRDVLRTDLETPLAMDGHAVGAGFHDVVGVQPAVGRGFAPADFQTGAPDVALLTYDEWNGSFGRSRDIIGQEIRLNERPVTVIGVMPKGFRFPLQTTNQFWTALRNDDSFLDLRATEYGVTDAMARLPDGMTLSEANERLARVTSGLTNPLEAGESLRVGLYGTNRLVGPQAEPIRKGLVLLFGASGLMLLVACINATNLLIARASMRSGEFSVRGAIGASGSRIVRQIGTETLLLAWLGGILAVAVSAAAIDAIRVLFPPVLTVFSTHAIEVIQGRVLLFTILLSTSIGLMAALGPALGIGLRATRWAGGVRSGSGSTGGRGLRSSFLVVQLAAVTVLLLGAGWIGTSFHRLSKVDVGYRTSDVVSVLLNLTESSYPEASGRFALATEFERRLEAIPGVSGATFGMALPPRSGIVQTPEVISESGARADTGPAQMIPLLWVRPDAFELLEIPLLYGSGPSAVDPDPQSVVVGEVLARELWGNESPVGRRFRFEGRDAEEWYTVRGVAAEVKLQRSDDPLGRFEIYQPVPEASTGGFLSFAVRSSRPVNELEPEIRRAFASLDPTTPVYEVSSLEFSVRDQLRQPRFMMVVMTGFTVVALILAMVGTYGVLSLSVGERMREVGIRLALGATSASVRTHIARSGVRYGAVGLALGIALGLALARYVEPLLFEVSAWDPGVLLGVAFLLLALTVIASYLPTRRAGRVDPMRILTSE